MTSKSDIHGHLESPYFNPLNVVSRIVQEFRSSAIPGTIEIMAAATNPALAS